jgi:cytoskeletal protein CcmA (bactofilin family)
MTDVKNDILDEEEFDTVLSPDIEFAGAIAFDKPFMIKGHVSGRIETSSDLVIAEGAFVEADIRASTLILRGSLSGNVFASKRIELTASGRMTGDIASPEILMETGCQFSGNCSMSALPVKSE